MIPFCTAMAIYIPLAIDQYFSRGRFAIGGEVLLTIIVFFAMMNQLKKEEASDQGE